MSKLPQGEVVYRLMVFILFLVIIALFFRPLSSPAPTSTAVPDGSVGPLSVINACQLPTAAGKGDTTINYQWQLMVRADTPTESVLFFTSDTNDFLCQAWRSPNGHYDNVVSSIGGFQTTKGAALTYEIGIASPIASDEANRSPAQLLIGQAPTGTTVVEIVTSDQEHHQATLGHGWYLAWVSLSQAGDKVVEIDAVGANGINITYLANPSGLSVGDTAAVSN